MKPFDLEKALAGHPIVYRNGEVPKEWHYFKDSKEEQIVTIDKNGHRRSCYDNGKYYIDGSKSDYDLFLAPKEETLWVAVAKKANAIENYHTSHAYTEPTDEFKELYPESDYTYHQITREVE